jgi:hypothetical protein
MEVSIENSPLINGVRLGKAPARSEPKLLQLASFMDTQKNPPKATNFWHKRSSFPLRSFGNRTYGDCTRASQALLSMRMERLETKRTPIITDEEVVRVYFEMSKRLYDGTDNGAFEIDALNEWRRPETTFHDSKGRPLTIDAYVRVNQADMTAVKNAIYTAGAHGIKVCFGLPLAWASVTDGIWDVPEGQMPIGEYLPNSWGGHSMTATDYDENYVYMPSSWATPDIKVTWRAFLMYADESYLVIDSIDSWKKKAGKIIDVMGIKKAVNHVSSYQIK